MLYRYLLGVVLVLVSCGSNAASAAPHRTGSVAQLIFSPDGTRLAAAYQRGTRNRRPSCDWWVVCWDLTTQEVAVHEECGAPIAFSPDGNCLAMSRDLHFSTDPLAPGTYVVFAEAMDPSVVTHLEPGEIGTRAMAVTFSPRGDRLIVLNTEGQVIQWRVEHLEEPPIVIDTREELSLGDTRFTRGRFAQVELSSWRSAGLYCLALEHTQEPTAGPDVRPRFFCWRPDRDSFNYGDLPEYAGSNPLLSLLEFAANQGPCLRIPQQELDTRPGGNRLRPPQRVAKARNGQCIESFGGVVKVKYGEPAIRHTFPAAGGHMIVDPTNTIVAIAGYSGTVRLWDLESGAFREAAYPDGRLERTLTVAAVQCPSEFGDLEENAKQLGYHVSNVARAGAVIIVLPEAALTGYLTPDISTTWQVNDRELGENLKGCDLAGTALAVNDPIFIPFRELAAEYGIYISIPFVEVDRRTGQYYNSVILFGPTGTRLIHYRKRNPWPWAEQSWATAGDLGNPIVDTPFGRLGCLICYNIHEQAAVMSELKIDTLLYSIAWVDEARSDWFETQLPAIAAAHDFNIIAANWSLPENTSVKWYGSGQSRVIDRSGTILAQAGMNRSTETVYTDLPLPPGPEP